MFDNHVYFTGIVKYNVYQYTTIKKDILNPVIWFSTIFCYMISCNMIQHDTT